ncbi:hypothetical protein [Micromonospora sp. DPT]|uniref:hypothetical protein n=1 Tax=Micromonospora sp. DPT TaxID=3142975 RepID=UPI0032089C7C
MGSAYPPSGRLVAGHRRSGPPARARWAVRRRHREATPVVAALDRRAVEAVLADLA